MFAFSGISATPAAPALSHPATPPAADFALFFAQQIPAEIRARQSESKLEQTPSLTVTETVSAENKLSTAGVSPEDIGTEVSAAVATAATLEMAPAPQSAPAEAPPQQNLPQQSMHPHIPVPTAEQPQPASASTAPAQTAPAQNPTPKIWVWETWHWAQQTGNTEPKSNTAEATDMVAAEAAKTPVLTKQQPTVTFQRAVPEPVAKPAPPADQPPEIPASEQHQHTATTHVETPAFVFAAPAHSFSTSDLNFSQPLPLSGWPVSLGPLDPSQSVWLTSHSAGMTAPVIFAALQTEAQPVLFTDSLPATLQSLFEMPLMPRAFEPHLFHHPERSTGKSPGKQAIFAALTQPTLGSALQRQLGLHSLKAVLQQSQQSLWVQLEPAWLGKMTLQVQRGQEGLQIQIVADYLLTRELLEAQAGLLRQQLSELGLVIASLRIGQGSTTFEDQDNEADKDPETHWHQGLPHSRGQPVFELDAGGLPGLLAEVGKSLPDISLIHFIV
ncbi:MAG: flagellar hook-length control protein FliK [Candidatus Sericytochromatia bacterium]|nr:flagellar hook-length control protein FliK [Candidatus Sericytochromatia bacterium]